LTIARVEAALQRSFLYRNKVSYFSELVEPLSRSASIDAFKLCAAANAESILRVLDLTISGTLLEIVSDVEDEAGSWVEEGI
jgi:hypothetical protein